jgi:diguanylate cyclase (GGDEF)-like protein
LSLWGFADNKKIREVCLEDVADKFFIRFCSTLADKVLDGKIAIESKCWMIDARGQYKFLNIKALPYLDIHNEIEFIVFSAVDCTSFKNDNERIKRAGQVDPLTGLFNRRAFDKKITSMEKEAIFPLILAVADVDNLKKINDEEGHLVGDEFLKDCGKFLKENFRENDFIARIGGDEFCVILPGCSIEAMKKILRRISQKSQCLNFSLGWDNKRYRAESIKEVFKRADKNMYQQKAIKKSS